VPEPRPALFRGQHDDLARGCYLPKRHHAGLVINSLTKYIGGHGNALGGAVTDTGLYDWTRFPNIYENYKNTKPATWGILQIRKKGLRDVGARWRPSPRTGSRWAPRRWRCGWTAAARTRSPSRAFLPPIRR
jgi:hypothetical protein